MNFLDILMVEKVLRVYIDYDNIWKYVYKIVKMLVDLLWKKRKKYFILIFKNCEEIFFNIYFYVILNLKKIYLFCKKRFFFIII